MDNFQTSDEGFFQSKSRGYSNEDETLESIAKRHKAIPLFPSNHPDVLFGTHKPSEEVNPLLQHNQDLLSDLHSMPFQPLQLPSNPTQSNPPFRMSNMPHHFLQPDTSRLFQPQQPPMQAPQPQALPPPSYPPLMYFPPYYSRPVHSYHNLSHFQHSSFPPQLQPHTLPAPGNVMSAPPPFQQPFLRSKPPQYAAAPSRETGLSELASVASSGASLAGQKSSKVHETKKKEGLEESAIRIIQLLQTRGKMIFKDIHETLSIDYRRAYDILNILLTTNLISKQGKKRENKLPFVYQDGNPLPEPVEIRDLLSNIQREKETNMQLHKRIAELEDEIRQAGFNANE